MWNGWKSMKLWKRILIAFSLAIIFGAGLKAAGLSDIAIAIQPVGLVFINAIKMLMVPIVFTTIVSGITSLQDGRKLGRMGGKTLGFYFLTTAFAVLIGLIVGGIIEPGAGITLPDAASSGQNAPDPNAAISVRDLLIGLIPANPVAAMADGNVLQIIVFAIFIGLSINLAGKKGAPVKAFFDSATEVIFKLVHMIMELAPFGIFALIIWVIGALAVDELVSLLWIVVALYLACFVQIGLVYTGLLTLGGRLHPVKFFRGIIDAQAVAFSTATSAGTLPVTMSNVEDNLGVPKRISSFVLPLGATMNMDGTAIYMGIAAMFTAQAIGVDLSMAQYITIILTGTLASIGAASIPSAGLILMPVVLSSVGLPLGAIILFFPIDRLMDMMRTVTNVTGDATISVLVAKSEGELDMDRFNADPVE
ncbi:dicarboxylate:amino acid:cation symporter DAACS family protein [Iodidimonas muriae]|uniref:Dicarboxylate:amino acid:cation symporter DAACS family protein n=2 Tax=Iodidimonas muriae TaxID=261467 RepID=A0ABQ2LFG2_9PROT|nr:dicarboxylate:amino acid:cation symporter DAACS family protein [Iodidimonas muriae]